MAIKVDTNSKEYYLIKTLGNEIKNSDNDKLRQTYNDEKLVYLDDDRTLMIDFMEILENLAETTLKVAPNHIKGDLKKLERDDVKEILKDNDIILYGKSGMRLNSKELKKYE